jgi:cytochrome c-type biogenesis protein CcmH
VKRNRIQWLVLGVVVLAAVVLAAWPSGDPTTNREQAREVASNLRCPDCEALSVAESSTPTARAIRRDVLERVRAGEPAESIYSTYAERYGESILLEPEGSGLGVIVWGLPVALLIAGGAGLVVVSRRWRREPQLHATDADEALVDKARHDE